MTETLTVSVSPSSTGFRNCSLSARQVVPGPG